MLPSEARRFFSGAIRYFFTTCPSVSLQCPYNYLFHKNPGLKYLFKKFSSPPPLIIEWCFYNSHPAHMHVAVCQCLFLRPTSFGRAEHGLKLVYYN